MSQLTTQIETKTAAITTHQTFWQGACTHFRIREYHDDHCVVLSGDCRIGKVKTVEKAKLVILDKLNYGVK